MKSALRAGIRRLPDPFDIAIPILIDFRRAFGRYPNVLFPKTFNEKIQSRKIFDRRARLCMWADKYRVREYVRDKIGPAVLPAIYHVTDDPSEIPFDRLPKQYIVKATHGSGWVYIVRDGDAVNRGEIIDRCKDWISTNYYELTNEWIYKDIHPRLLIEELLDPDNRTGLPDYKFFVFGGKVKAIQVDVGRHTAHKRNLYDLDWRRINCRFKFDNCDTDIAKPENLATMIDYAQALSDNIDFVRVDLYNVFGEVYFGEMTSTPANGFGKFHPADWDRIFGDFWEMRFPLAKGLI